MSLSFFWLKATPFVNHHGFVENHGIDFLSQNFFQLHLSFALQMILFANLNVNADRCILLFLD